MEKVLDFKVVPFAEIWEGGIAVQLWEGVQFPWALADYKDLHFLCPDRTLRR